MENQIQPLLVPEITGCRTEWQGPAALLSTAGGSTLRLVRVARTELARCYPYGREDVCCRIEHGGDDLAERLAELPAALWQVDPTCRRLVVPVPVDDLRHADTVRAAGLVPVVEVDDGTEELVLHVAEPDWVRRVTGDI